MKRMIAIAVLGSALLGACSSDSNNSNPPAATSTSDATQTADSSPPASPDAGTEEGTVTIKGFLFKPAKISIAAGSAVTWRNDDDILHTATSGTPDAPKTDFDGQMETAGSTFKHTFSEPGTYAYFCSRHNHMVGEVVVT